MIKYLLHHRSLGLLIVFNFLFIFTKADPSNKCDTSVPGNKSLVYIDPTIGNVAQLLEPTRPTANLPNQVIRVYPLRKDYLDDQISGFPLTAVSHRLGEVFCIMPSSQDLTPASWEQKMPYDHDLEITRPWYFSTYLLEDEITVEFSPGKKTGIYRFSFPSGKNRSILFKSLTGGFDSLHFFSPDGISAIETWHGNIKVFLFGHFSRAGIAGFPEDDQNKTAGWSSQKSSKAYISFPAGRDHIEFRYALSFVSARQAEINYQKEIANKSFEAVKENGEHIWSGVVAQIQVEGGTENQRRSFYTALYRCNERMVNISEDSFYYSGFNNQINTAQRSFYVDDWSWDTYLALHPLRMILHPSLEEDMLQSYVLMYKQSQWMPTFPVLFGDYACMNGFHSSIVFLDAYRKGLRKFDIEMAYEGMRKNAVSATLIPWRNGDKTVLDDFYQSKG